MRLTIVDRKEFTAGLIFVGIGVFGTIESTSYRLGSATQMGPGYFPLCLSLVLIALGLGAAVKAVRATIPEPLGSWPLIPLLFVILGVVAFGLTIDRHGLAVAVLLLVILTCYQRLRRRPLEVALIALVLIAFTVGLFIYGLSMPFYLYR